MVLVVIDASEPLDPSDLELLRSADDRTLVCLNKLDLRAAVDADKLKSLTDAPVMELSAASGQGIPALMEELARRVAVDGEADGLLTAQRHIDLARKAYGALAAAIGAIEAGLPLDTSAIDILEALEHLSEITGENATEAVIDRVFATFCVGK